MLGRILALRPFRTKFGLSLATFARQLHPYNGLRTRESIHESLLDLRWRRGLGRSRGCSELTCVFMIVMISSAVGPSKMVSGPNQGEHAPNQRHQCSMYSSQCSRIDVPLRVQTCPSLPPTSGLVKVNVENDAVKIVVGRNHSCSSSEGMQSFSYQYIT